MIASKRGGGRRNKKVNKFAQKRQEEAAALHEEEKLEEERDRQEENTALEFTTSVEPTEEVEDQETSIIGILDHSPNPQLLASRDYGTTASPKNISDPPAQEQRTEAPLVSAKVKHNVRSGKCANIDSCPRLINHFFQKNLYFLTKTMKLLS